MKTSKPKKITSEALAQAAAAAAEDNKGLDVVVLDLRKESSYADFIVVASGTSDRHVHSLAENIEAALSKLGSKPMGREGLKSAQWTLVDFGSVVIHVFHEHSRSEYAIEDLHSNAKRLRVGQAPAPTPTRARRS